VKIRRARAEEAAALSALARRSKAHWGYDAEFMARCREELTVSLEDEAYVLESDGELLGFYALEGPELSFLFVVPEQLGRGLGRLLIEHAKAHARARGHHRLKVDSDPHAVGFYRAVGGRQVGEVASASVPGRMLPQFLIDL
jgi:GNAT superfamily N-acetyltransferase